MKKLLICGDSFAADWTVKCDGTGWVNMLCNDFEVTNIAQAGVSEYKIYKQLISQDLSKFDRIIISHTSFYRIPVKEHPLYLNNKLHKNCDLIYNDLVDKVDVPLIKVAVDFFENLYDLDYAIFIHNLILKEIDNLSDNLLNITFFDYFGIYKLRNFHQFDDVFEKNKGVVNHMDDVGNMIIYNQIKKLLP